MPKRNNRMTPFGSWLVTLIALGLLGCQSTTTTSGFAPVAAPKLVLGDHWQYRIVDNLHLGMITMLDQSVVAIDGGVATLRLAYDGPAGKSETTELIDAAGGLVVGSLKAEAPRKFPMPIEMYRFPLEPSETWRQQIPTISPESNLKDEILVYGTVRGQEQVTVPAGTFTTVYIFRVFQLDDKQFWRTRTTRDDLVWFAAEVKGPVREIRKAQYDETGQGPANVIRTEYTTRELVSFQPGNPK